MLTVAGSLGVITSSNILSVCFAIMDKHCLVSFDSSMLGVRLQFEM